MLRQRGGGALGSIGRGAVDAIPFIGGTIGEKMGQAVAPMTGPVAPAIPPLMAAGVGASATQLQQIIRALSGDPRAPRSLGEAAQGVAGEYAAQGIGSAAGAAGVGALKGIGGQIYRTSARVPQRIKAAFGKNIADVGFEERLPVGRVVPKNTPIKGKPGSQRADELIDKLVKKRQGKLDKAEVEGAEFTAADFLSEVKEERAKMAKKLPNNPGRLEEVQAFDARIAEFIDERTDAAGNLIKFPPTPTRHMLSAIQGDSDKALAAAADPKAAFPPKFTGRARADKALAQGGRRGMESQIPEVAPLNKRIRGLMGTREFLDAAESRDPLQWPAIASSLPQFGTRVGLGVSHPFLLFLAKYSPRLFAEAMLAESENDTTGGQR
jgi:hypothetical protein